MALKKCKDCGNEISKKAAACPNCGAKQKKGTSIVTWLIAVVIIGFVVTRMNEVNTRDAGSPQESSTTSSSTVSETSARQQPERTERPAPSWRVSSSVDEMSGDVSYFASSPRAMSNDWSGRLYRDTESWVAVGCKSGSSPWVYFGFTNTPNITGDNTKSGYSESTSRVKWDEELGSMKLTQSHGSSFMHAVDDSSALGRLESSSKVMLELSWYRQRAIKFEYTLNGSASAIREALAACNSGG